MKIQHGILGDEAEKPRPAPTEAPHPVSVEVEKNRLFETLEKEDSSGRGYARLLLLAAAAVVVIGGAIFYFTLPGTGDVVRAPRGAEDAVRDHLQTKQKRAATDITFYYCSGNSYWARAGVETRSDVPNPVYRLDKYAVSLTGPEGNWDISSKPVASTADDQPCR